MEDMIVAAPVVAVVLLFVIAELMLLVLYLRGVDSFGHFVHYCAVSHLTGCALGLC